MPNYKIIDPFEIRNKVRKNINFQNSFLKNNVLSNFVPEKAHCEERELSARETFFLKSKSTMEANVFGKKDGQN